ncbi:MAG: nucleotide exchange factor GrpE [Eubacteriales bacterium]|nr:nucleotide exchange factor GrpE [Eubacteriales bacterium]
MSKEKKNPEEETVEESTEAVENAEEVEETSESQEEDKYKELEDKYIRLLAEYDNYQKRTTREKEARYGDAVIDTAAAFLPVMDDLTRALELEVTNDEAVKVKEGIELVAKKLKDVLSKLDIEEIAAVGEEFDPNIHNAIQHIEDETVTENTIVEEYMKGYIYKGTRVVRHSMVKVAN